LAEKLRALVAEATFDGVGTVTVSIGASQLRADDDLASWLRRADQAMYAAKLAGRNTVRVDP
jgi:diguanylate cyclase (GGDEF)-like protein